MEAMSWREHVTSLASCSPLHFSCIFDGVKLLIKQKKSDFSFCLLKKTTQMDHENE